MEKLSRVKKYEQLRKDIDTNPSEEIQSGQLSQYANRLNEFDPVLFKKMEVKEENHVPVREKKELNDTNNDLFNTDTFRNEYMDDIIKDVKQYNIQRGLMESENTQIDILHQLNRPVVKRREDYIKELNDESKESIVKPVETTSQSKQEIAKQIQELLQESEEMPVQGMSVKRVEIEKTPEIAMQPQNIQEDMTHEFSVMSRMNEDFQRKITEETQQIRVQLGEYEEEMTGLNKNINKTHQLLNLIMILLIVAFLVIIGISIFWILQSMGKI